MIFMNLTEDIKPVKKINTGFNSQPTTKTTPNAHKAPKTKSRSMCVEDTRDILTDEQNSNKRTEINAFHYLAQEIEVPLDEEFKKSSIDIIAWNINGIRAMGKKQYLKELIRSKDPDIICFYELKCDKYSYISQNICKKFNFMEIYPYKYFNFSQISGYAGVAVYSKVKPLNYSFNIGDPDIDKESRFIKLEFKTFHFISVYVPTSGEGLKRLDYRIDKWDATFKSYCSKLRKDKPVVIAGDMNVAHKEIDIHDPKVK